MSGHFGPTFLGPRCLGSKVSWVRSVRLLDLHSRVQLGLDMRQKFRFHVRSVAVILLDWSFF